MVFKLSENEPLQEENCLKCSWKQSIRKQLENFVFQLFVAYILIEQHQE